MGAGRRRTAVSVGLLALALATLPLGAGAAAAGIRDCERGGGLLSGVTNGVCELVDGVTDTVDSVTGSSLGPVTGGVDKTTGTVLGTVGEVAPTGRPAPSPTTARVDSTQEPPPPAAGDGDGGLVAGTLEDVCLPVLACEGQGVLGSVTDPRPQPSPSGSPGAKDTPSPSATPTPTPSRRPREAGILPTEAPTPPFSRPHMETGDRVAEEPVPVDPDDPRVELLWPGPFSEKLSDQIGERAVRPSEPDSDLLGTALTAVLLASAVLAARVSQQRRRRAEHGESMPFEPMRVGGRHRLA
ncbi:hypothetical protein [Nonomuraea africana]|uniref:Uncharacterized protein n=1 Tax=Nonomuraea africana TaxID=46171 RepID=A0ABR9KGC8_9ACTN|nr:hypothetical protein [Nonomuraea africana]MBE1560698.1 hypothetical protein [Nonomuraea africana]